MSAINVNSITGRTGTHGPVLTGVTTVSDALVVGGTDSTAKLNVFGGDIQIGTGLTFKSSSSIGNLNLQGGYIYPGGWIKLSGGSSDDNIVFGTSSNNATKEERVRITSDGDVGIGQTNPQGDLHIGNISGSKNIIMHSANQGNARVRFREGGSTTSGFNEYSIGMVGLNNALTVEGQGAGEIIRIMGDTGLVGIGTDAPNQKLHIHADGTSYIRFTDESSGTSATDGAIFGLDGTNLYAWNYEAGDFVVATSGNNKFTVKNSGNIEIPDGNLVIGTSGHGIDFSATGDTAGATSELLDDYEEGAHVPALAATTGTLGSITYSADTGGKYIKIGSIVHFWGTVRWSAYNVGSGSGSIQVTMPFTNVARTSGDDADNAGAAFSPVWGGTSDKVPTTVFGIQNQNKLGFRSGSNDSVASSVQVSQVGPTGMVNFSITYQTSS